MRFQLVSVSGMKYDGDAYEVLVPTKAGTIAVFDNHMPLISAGTAGVLSVRKKASDKDDSMQDFAVNGGIMEVDGHTLRFLSEEVTEAHEISEKEAEAALARAQDLISNAGSHRALEEAKRTLQHSEAKLHVAKLKRRRHP